MNPDLNQKPGFQALVNPSSYCMKNPGANKSSIEAKNLPTRVDI